MRSLETKRLAAIHYPKGFHIDQLIADVCDDLRARGVKLGGLLQVSQLGDGTCRADVHAIDLRTGAMYEIWEDRGAGATACRLDERGLGEAARAIQQAVSDQVDIVVINRFGRAESQGRGLLDEFAMALEAGVPTLTSVREPYVGTWENFHGGLAEPLRPEREQIVDWALQLSGSSSGTENDRALAT